MNLINLRWWLGFAFSVVLIGCTTTKSGTSELDLDEWDIDTEQIGCTDTQKTKLRCEMGQILTSAGCGEDTRMKRCASCTPIDGITCAANSAAIEIPECPEKEHGDCVPVEKRVRKSAQNETE